MVAPFPPEEVGIAVRGPDDGMALPIAVGIGDGWVVVWGWVDGIPDWTTVGEVVG